MPDLMNNHTHLTTSLVPESSRDCDWSAREELLLAPYAMFAKNSEGRKQREQLHPYRSPFQRDRDRILHSAAFRRLSGKMQVFTGDMGDYHRTRLTHTHEVSTIARTIGRALRLNEDLIEALALMHDIGHPPYGHSGEDALNECLLQSGVQCPEGKGFSHNSFALVLAEELEYRYANYPGLNLTHEVLSGQAFRITHAGALPLLEVQVVDLADSIAYNAHDVDDALTLGLLHPTQLDELALVQRAREWSGFNTPLRDIQAADRNEDSPRGVASDLAQQKRLVHSLIDVQVADVLELTRQRLAPVSQLDQLAVRELEIAVELSPMIASEREELAQFLFANVYRHPQLMRVREQAALRVQRLYERLVAIPSILPPAFQERAEQTSAAEAVRDYIAGMTDRFCDACYKEVVEGQVPHAPAW